MLVQVGGEAAAGSGGRTVQGTGAALLGTAAAVGLEAEQLQDGGHGDGGADGGEVDRGTSSDSGLTLRAFALGLA